MALRALVLGSKLKAILVAVAVLTASIGGAWALGIVGTPSVAAVENRFGAVDRTSTVVETDLVVNNPNPVGVTLGDTTINYSVAMNNISIAQGSKQGLNVDPGNTTLNFSTKMQNSKIPEWWVTHIRNGERTTVYIDAKAKTGLLGGRVFPFQETQPVETDIIGQFNSEETRPVNSGSLPPTLSNPVLYINETSASWGEVTANETPIPMTFVAYNPHTQPYTISEVGYEITMNGVGVGSGSTQGLAIVIPPKGTADIDTRTVIRNPTLDDWWVTHLRNDQVTNLKIDFYATVELPTGNEIRLPLDRLTYERRIETDIFGNKDEQSDRPARTTPTATQGDTTPTGPPTNTAGSMPGDADGGTATPTDGGILGALSMAEPN